MSRETDEWDDIVKSWHSDNSERTDSTRVPARHHTDQALEAKVKGAVKAGLIETVFSVTLGLALSGYILWEIIGGLPSALDYVLYSGMLAMVFMVAFFSVRLRRGAWRAEGKGTMAYLALLLKQANSAIKLIKMGKVFSVAIVGLIYAMAGSILVMMLISGDTIAKPGTAALIMGFVTLFFPGMIYILHKKQKRFVARKYQLESMLESLR